MTDARSREVFYKTLEAKFETHAVIVNFFEPKSRQKTSVQQHTAKTTLTSTYVLYVHKPTPMKITWAAAKQQVFSSDSSSTASDSSASATIYKRKSEQLGLWLWAAAANPGSKPQSHRQHHPVTQANCGHRQCNQLNMRTTTEASHTAAAAAVTKIYGQ